MNDLFGPPPQTLQQATTAASGVRRLSANGRPIGRPPGARNRGSTDLARYIEATFGGMTPGQQAAQLGLVTPAELKNARRDAAELVDRGLLAASILEVRIPAMELAHLVKAVRLAQGLGCEVRDAYLLGQKERQDLMKYVHQVQPAAKPKDAAALPTVFLVPEGEAQAQLPDFSDGDPDALEFVEVSDAPPRQVGRGKSDDAA